MEEKENDENKVGFMYKKGANRTNWKKRYFILLGNELSYYNSENVKQQKKQRKKIQTYFKIEQFFFC